MAARHSANSFVTEERLSPLVVAKRASIATVQRLAPPANMSSANPSRTSSQSVGVTSGEVRASDGSVSGQWDVLIYNRLDTPRMYLSAGAAVLPIEG